MAEAQEHALDDTLVEMTYRWGDVELELPRWTRKNPSDLSNPIQIGAHVAAAIEKAFRVEALLVDEANDFGAWEQPEYHLLFDVADVEARDGAARVRKETRFVERVIAAEFGGGAEPTVGVRVCSSGTPATGQICGRGFEPPPKTFLDVTEIPTPKPGGDVPYIEKDNYWLTPIEVPFYDALRDTGAIFAVQPWVQGVETRYRPDFMVFYDGGIAVVELDGHETHKSREQRTRDAKRQRWFEARGIQVLRWTGSEVHATSQECVRELLEIVRGKQARF